MKTRAFIIACGFSGVAIVVLIIGLWFMNATTGTPPQAETQTSVPQETIADEEDIAVLEDACAHFSLSPENTAKTLRTYLSSIEQAGDLIVSEVYGSSEFYFRVRSSLSWQVCAIRQNDQQPQCFRLDYDVVGVNATAKANTVNPEKPAAEAPEATDTTPSETPTPTTTIIKVTDAANLKTYVGEETAAALPNVLAEYLSDKGIAGDVANATIDVANADNGEYVVYVGETTLDIEVDSKTQMFGIGIR